MMEIKELIEVIGEDNVGIQLDSFYWYCVGEIVVDLLSLDKGDVVIVDFNDVCSGFFVDDQIDGK